MQIKPTTKNQNTTMTFKKLKGASIVEVDGEITLNQLSDAIRTLTNVEKLLRSKFKYENKSPHN